VLEPQVDKAWITHLGNSGGACDVYGLCRGREDRSMK